MATEGRDYDGPLEMLVEAIGDQVVVTFRNPVLWMALQPEMVDDLIATLQVHKKRALEARSQRLKRHRNQQ